MRRNTRQFRWIKILSAILHFVISTVYVTSNCIRRNTRQFRWIKILGSCYIELYKAQHPPVQMDKKIKCDLNSVISIVYVTSNCMRRNTRQFRWIKILSAILHFVISTVYVTSNCIRRNTRQFRWIKILGSCYIELYKAQHPPVQMDKNIKCDLNSVISTVYVTSNCMRRNTRQFRWIKILGSCYIELYKAQHPPVQMDKNITCDLNSVISTVHVTSNCIRRTTRQFR